VSTKFSRPSYQAGVPGLPSACATMRCVPDISADADPATGYSIFTQGAWASVGGTSAAAPLWAGFTAVYNQDATAAGKAKLGFANPVLYGLAKATQPFTPFHDITTGHTSTATNWPAGAGYDLATGLGSLDANNLARDLLGTGGPPSNDFSIAASPTSLTIAQGASASSAISTAVTSGSAQTIALAAGGLPSGATATLAPTSVTAGAGSTLTLTAAASTPAGTYPVTITGTGASATHAVTVTLVVSATGGGGPVQLVANGGFETGAAPWSLSTGVLNNSTSEPPHAGAWDAWLDGYGTTHTDTATQSVTIPAGKTSATLQFYLHIDTAETTTTTAYDKLTVKVGSTTIATFSNLNKAAGYTVHAYDLGNRSGQALTLSFSGTEDSSLKTSFVLDDVTLTAS
jgi:kumamolisin